MFYITLSLSLIFTILAGIHFYWAISGVGMEKTLPTDEHGKRVLNPSSKDCVIVGVVLLAFAAVYFIQLGFSSIVAQSQLINVAKWIIPFIFLIRSIGDFKYVGFFKKIKKTDFAKMDTKIYTPMCCLIAFLSLLLNR